MKTLKTVIEKAESFMLSGQYSSARVFFTNALSQAENGELLALADELRAKLSKAKELEKAEHDAILRAVKEKNTRRAYCVNKVNYNHMLLAKRVSDFLTLNPVEVKTDGYFTKKYQSKIDVLKTELSAMVDGSEIEFTVFRYQYNLEMLELSVKGHYLGLDNNRVKYQTSERIRASDSNLLVLPVNRTGETYLESELELKEKEKELSALTSRISELKRIIEE